MSILYLFCFGVLSPADEPLNTESNFSNPTTSMEMFHPINLHKSQLPLVNSVPPSMISKNPAVFPNKQPLLLSHQSSQAQTTLLPPQFIHQQAQETFLQPPISASYNEPAPTLNYASVPQGPLQAMPSAPFNLPPVVHPTLPISNIPGRALHLPRGRMPPPLLGPPPHSLPALPVSQGSNQLGGGGYSGLISSLMAQGLISLANQAPVQVEDKLKLSAFAFWFLMLGKYNTR